MKYLSVLVAKGPPVPKLGGALAVQGPPKAASDSAVMAKSQGRDPQSPSAIQGEFPTPAESVGRTVPKKKPPPTGKPKARSSSLSLKAAYASVSSAPVPGKVDSQQPASSASTARTWKGGIASHRRQSPQQPCPEGEVVSRQHLPRGAQHRQPQEQDSQRSLHPLRGHLRPWKKRERR